MNTMRKRDLLLVIALMVFFQFLPMDTDKKILCWVVAGGAVLWLVVKTLVSLWATIRGAESNVEVQEYLNSLRGSGTRDGHHSP